MSKSGAVKPSGLRGKIKVFILLTIVGLCAILVLAISLFIFEIEDTIYCNGIMVPEHTFEIVGHIDAHILKFYKRRGDDVKQNEVIAELDSRTYESDAIAAQAAIRELEAELEVKKAELSILEKEPLPKDLWYSATNLKECQEKVELSRDRYQRSKKLQLVSAISKVEFEKIALEAIQREAELARAEENARRVASGLGAKYIEKAKRDVALVAAKITGKKAELAYLQRRISECRIVAPAAGRILDLECKNTWYVARGKVAAKIASGKKIRAIAKIDARYVRKVKPGQKVRVTSDVYNKYQYGNFPGVINWIGDAPWEEESKTGNVYYPAEVEMDSEGCTLKFGSGVEIAIITGRQPAIFALLNMSDEDFKEVQRRRMMHRKADGGFFSGSGKDRK